MRALNPRSYSDWRITAFTRSFPIKTRPDGTITQGTWRYNCWGKKHSGLFKQTVTAEYSKKITGQRTYITLRLMKRGCCPPQLMIEFLKEEGMTADERDPIEEAMKVRKRGYFGEGD